MISNKSSVADSPKRLKLDEVVIKQSNLAKLEEVEQMAANSGSKVDITGKIVSLREVSEVRSVSKNKVFRKQECVISNNPKILPAW